MIYFNSKLGSPQEKLGGTFSFFFAPLRIGCRSDEVGGQVQFPRRPRRGRGDVLQVVLMVWGGRTTWGERHGAKEGSKGS